MISREEFEKTIYSFLEEARFIVAVEAEKPNGESLQLAFNRFDNFVETHWNEAITESYYLYMDLSGGKSPRHPDAQEGHNSSTDSEIHNHLA